MPVDKKLGGEIGNEVIMRIDKINAVIMVHKQ